MDLILGNSCSLSNKFSEDELLSMCGYDKLLAEKHSDKITINNEVIGFYIFDSTIILNRDNLGNIDRILCSDGSSISFHSECSNLCELNIFIKQEDVYKIRIDDNLVHESSSHSCKIIESKFRNGIVDINISYFGCVINLLIDKCKVVGSLKIDNSCNIDLFSFYMPINIITKLN